MSIGSFLKKSLYIVSVYLLVVLPLQAAPDFIIEDIRVEGLQRLTPGTVFNYLPMKVGDEFNDQRSGEVVRVLF